MRCAAFTAATGNSLHAPEGDPRHEASTVQHFYDKLLHIKDRMKTEPGKRAAERRHKLVWKLSNLSKQHFELIHDVSDARFLTRRGRGVQCCLQRWTDAHVLSPALWGLPSSLYFSYRTRFQPPYICGITDLASYHICMFRVHTSQKTDAITYSSSR